MKLSVILCTLRDDPKFEWMAESLAIAAKEAPYVDFELLVVDGVLWDKDAQREAQLLTALLSSNLEDYVYDHVEPKPCAWQGPYRRTNKNHFALCNARNTGLIHMRGDHAVFVDDCCVIDKEFLKRHWAAAKRGWALAGSFVSYNRATIVNGVITEGELHPGGKDARGQELKKPAPGGWLWGLNMSFPLSYAISINGYDEMYDGQGGSEDCDFGVRLERAGCPIVYDPDCLVYQILETHEPIGDRAEWKGEPKTHPKELKLKNGESHFANEFLIQTLVEDRNRVAPLGNDFYLSNLRKRIKNPHLSLPTNRDPKIDWRDGQPLEEM